MYRVFIGVGLLVGSSIASAEWYMGAGVGSQEPILNLQSLSLEVPMAEETSSRHNPGFSLFGGYRANQFFSLELEYQEQFSIGLGEMFPGSSLWFAPEINTDVNANALFLSGKSTLTLGDRTSLTMKGGVFNWEVETPNFYANNPLYQNGSGVDLFYGLGATYDISKHFGIRAEWEHFDVDNNEQDFVSTGFNFSF